MLISSKAAWFGRSSNYYRHVIDLMYPPAYELTRPFSKQAISKNKGSGKGYISVYGVIQINN